MKTKELHRGMPNWSSNIVLKTEMFDPATNTWSRMATMPNAGIKSVVLIRPGSVTHSVNFEQRLVRCRFEGSGGSYTVTAPWKAQIAPPGWYMLFVVDDADVPSVATWVRLIGSPDVPYICW